MIKHMIFFFFFRDFLCLLNHIICLSLAWLDSHITFILGQKKSKQNEKTNYFIFFVTEFRSPCGQGYIIGLSFFAPTYHPLSLVLVVAFVVTCTWSSLALLPINFQHRVKRKRNNGCITFLSRRPAEQARRCTIHFSAAAVVKMLLDLFDLAALFVFLGARQIIVLLFCLFYFPLNQAEGSG